MFGLDQKKGKREKEAPLTYFQELPYNEPAFSILGRHIVQLDQLSFACSSGTTYTVTDGP